MKKFNKNTHVYMAPNLHSNLPVMGTYPYFGMRVSAIQYGVYSLGYVEISDNVQRGFGARKWSEKTKMIKNSQI